MKLSTLRPPRFFSYAKKGKKEGGGGGKNRSFCATASSEESAVSTPRSVLPARAVVTARELQAVLRRLATAEDELVVMLAEAERGVALEEIGAGADEGELRETFAVFDADGDGRISAEELLAVLAALGDERCSIDDCRRMIGGVDTDGDGFVCFDEFARMMHGR